MKKQSSGSTTKDQKGTGANKAASQSKQAKGMQGSSSSTAGATSKVKSKVGHGLANEGTNVSYDEE
ncbi:MAG: hypothetical protein JWR61_2035 [Ferruginibacter sp.]|uniref:hypothetical protein n=1 Tax=Ferruginibacter sp. TaxID=1940288 RepID=UPI002659B3C6|nr:hypothetical protein [Ferruginibacter sp.]MDB5277080.1 hypothetical protein [Ferruginibacter sp.]